MVLAVLVLASAPSAIAQEEEDGFSFEIRFVGERDDNVGLTSGEPGDDIKEDTVFRLSPSLHWHQTKNQNTFDVEALAVARRGVNTDLSEANVGVSATANLVHPNGWIVDLFDRLSRTTFDQALFVSGSLAPGQDFAAAEVGVNETYANAVGARVAYTPARRFSVEGGGAFTWARIDSGAEAEQIDKRKTYSGDVKITVPVLQDVVAYAKGLYLEQDDEFRLLFSFERQRYVGGFELDANERLKLWVEGGIEKIDFLDGEGTEHDNPIVLGGLDLILSDSTILNASAGTDGYDNPVFGLLFNKLGQDGGRLTITSRKSTENSFSRTTAGRTFDAVLASIALHKPFYERWRIKLDASLFQLNSKPGEGPGADEQDDQTNSVRGEVGYQFRPWLEVGAAYRYSERQSLRASNRFTDNRGGILLTFIFD